MELSNLPTILEVINRIIKQCLPSMRMEDYFGTAIPSLFGYSPEGKYVLTPRNDGKYALLPSGNRNVLFRGQNRYYQSNKPSLYRPYDSKSNVARLLKRQEFLHLLDTHPVLEDIEHEGFYHISKMALAQHYGFPTNLMDVTCDIWAAAFFATTKYDPSNDSYTPVGDDFGDGYGVLYVCDDHKTIKDENLDYLGYHYFPRPCRQMACTYCMKEDANFNDIVLFKKYYFRHCLRDSKWVFAMSNNQKKYFPKDTLADMAKRINNTRTISKSALDSFISSDICSFGTNDIKQICNDLGLTIVDAPENVFSDKYIHDVSEWWENEGRKNIERNIEPFLLSDL